MTIFYFRAVFPFERNVLAQPCFGPGGPKNGRGRESREEKERMKKRQKVAMKAVMLFGYLTKFGGSGTSPLVL